MLKKFLVTLVAFAAIVDCSACTVQFVSGAGGRGMPVGYRGPAPAHYGYSLPLRGRGWEAMPTLSGCQYRFDPSVPPQYRRQVVAEAHMACDRFFRR